ncbi:MAG: hypothetical protein AAGF11_42135 [Myxococcota bacterium]
MREQVVPEGWHVRSWSVWGRLETAAKGVGIVASAAGVLMVTTAASIQISGLGYGLVGVVGVLALLSIVQLLLRIGQKEVTSLVFAVANLLGYAGLVDLVLYAPQATWVPMVFGGAYVAGELIKQRFLAVSGYTENGQSTAQMTNFSRVMAGLHALVAVLALLR